MKKVNALLISIFIVIILPLLTLTMSAPSAGAATYYVDAIFGNDDTGIPDNIGRPFKTINKINSFLKAGTIVAGDYIKFRQGFTAEEQTFRGILRLYNCSGSPNAPITITSYAVNAEDSYKPTINAGYLVSDHSLIAASGAYTPTGATWTGPDENGVYIIPLNCGTLFFENQIPLKAASGPACSDGNWYYNSASTPKILYYRPNSGTPADYLLEVNVYGRAIEAYNNSYIIVDGIKFILEGIYINTSQNSLSNWIIQDCDFLYGGIRVLNGWLRGRNFPDITVQSCNFDFCATSSMSFETNMNGTATYERLNILRNKVTNNNILRSTGQPWGMAADRDCIAIQNMKDSNIIGNDLSGSCVDNAGITYWVHTWLQGYWDGSVYKSNIIGGVTDNGKGEIRISTIVDIDPASLTTGDRVYVYNIGGVDNATGYWIVTIIDSRHFDLNGSIFAGSYTSGGNIYRTSDLPSTGNTVAHNFIHDVTGCGIRWDAGSLPSNHTAKIYGNIITNFTGYAGISIAKGQDSIGTLIANNVINNGIDGIRINAAYNYIISNNIITNMTRYYIYYISSGPNTINYNCYHDVSSGNKFRYQSSDLSFSLWQGSAGWDASSLATDPLITNKSGIASLVPDFELTSISPCIYKGINVGLSSDFYCRPIPADSAFVDMGPFQSQTLDSSSLPEPSISTEPVTSTEPEPTAEVITIVNKKTPPGLAKKK